jgi:hypothetical protein
VAKATTAAAAAAISRVVVDGGVDVLRLQRRAQLGRIGRMAPVQGHRHQPGHRQVLDVGDVAQPGTDQVVGLGGLQRAGFGDAGGPGQGLGGAGGGGVGSLPALRPHDDRGLSGELAGPAGGGAVGGDHPHGGQAGQEAEHRHHEDQRPVASLCLRQEGRRAPALRVESLAHVSP